MPEKPLVALFIDAENASSRHASVYVNHCLTLGRLSIARCYGAAATLKKWEKAIAAHHIIPMLTPPSASKQNASDFALTIDAVAALHRRMFDIAVVASSDADFTQLAIHVREHGKIVVGIGAEKANKQLRDAFDTYFVVPAARTASSKVSQSNQPASNTKTSPFDTDWLRSIFAGVSKDGETVDLQVLGRKLAAAKSDYKKGHRTLQNFLKKSGIFAVSGDKVRLTD